MMRRILSCAETYFLTAFCRCKTKTSASMLRVPLRLNGWTVGTLSTLRAAPRMTGEQTWFENLSAVVDLEHLRFAHLPTHLLKAVAKSLLRFELRLIGGININAAKTRDIIGPRVGANATASQR